jgi:hypothetical protein
MKTVVGDVNENEEDDDEEEEGEEQAAVGDDGGDEGISEFAPGQAPLVKQVPKGPGGRRAVKA